MTTIRSFPPLASDNVVLLILGSMPGEASLAAEQYYAHPRNSFWTILGELLGFSRDAEYAERVESLLRARLAVWDVLKSCQRTGSLDSRIDVASERPNAISHFVESHASIRRIVFNGAKAESAFRRHLLSRRMTLSSSTFVNTELVRAPSTSPAHAGLAYADKLTAWRQALEPVIPAFPVGESPTAPTGSPNRVNP